MQHSDPAQCIEALRVRIIEAETANTALRIELRAAREEAEELVKQNERLRETLVGLEFQRHPRSRLRPLRPDDGNEGGDGLTDPPPASS